MKIGSLFSKSKRELSRIEINTFLKIAYYLVNNCHYAYDVQYIPHLVNRFGRVFDMNVITVNGDIVIPYNGKNYVVPYCFNQYKDKIIDLGLFVLKESIGEIIDGIEPDSIPYYVIGDIPHNIGYMLGKPMLMTDYQTHVLGEGDELILALYNDCKLYEIAEKIKSMELSNIELEPVLNISTIPCIKDK